MSCIDSIVRLQYLLDRVTCDTNVVPPDGIVLRNRIPVPRKDFYYEGLKYSNFKYKCIYIKFEMENPVQKYDKIF